MSGGLGEAVTGGLLAGFGVAVPVGAIGALIVGLAARSPWRVGAAAALGVATADAVYAVVAVLGGAALADLIAPVAGALRWVAAAVLLVLAARTAREALAARKAGEALAVRAAREALAVRREGAVARAAGGRTARPRGAYLTLLGLTLLNPATIVYFGALVLGRRAGDGRSAAGEAVWVAAAFVASASWQLVLAGGGALLGRVLTGARGRLGTALVSSAVIAALAVLLVV